MALTKAGISQFISMAILWFKDSANRHVISAALVGASGNHAGVSGNPIIVQSTEKDPVSGAQTVIDFVHKEIHDGDSFSASVVNADLDDDKELSIAFITPDSAKYMHMFFVASNTSAAIVEILEGPTITAGSGSQIQMYNRDRNSATTSLAKDTDGVVNKLTKTPTISSDGTVLRTALIGSGKSKIAGQSQSIEEFILKRNTKYAYRITGNANDGRASLRLVWYEHEEA